MSTPMLRLACLPLLLAVPHLSCAHATDVVTAQTPTFYQDRCGGCHSAPPRHAYSAAEWPAIVDGMRVEARLTDDQRHRLVVWLQGGLP